MSTKRRPIKGDRVECPECHRFVGYWPDKLNPYKAHLMRHRSGKFAGSYAHGPWCERRTAEG